MKDSHLSPPVTPYCSWTWCLHPALPDLPCGLKTDFQSLLCIMAFTEDITTVCQSPLAGLRVFCQSQSAQSLPRENNVMNKLMCVGSSQVSNEKNRGMGFTLWTRNGSTTAQGDPSSFQIGRENVLESLDHPQLLAISLSVILRVDVHLTLTIWLR